MKAYKVIIFHVIVLSKNLCPESPLKLQSILALLHWTFALFFFPLYFAYSNPTCEHCTIDKLHQNNSSHGDLHNTPSGKKLRHDNINQFHGIRRLLTAGGFQSITFNPPPFLNPKKEGNRGKLSPPHPSRWGEKIRVRRISSDSRLLLLAELSSLKSGGKRNAALPSCRSETLSIDPSVTLEFPSQLSRFLVLTLV